LLVERPNKPTTTDGGRALEQALNLWRGTPLAEFAYESFAQPAARRLEELRLVTLERRIDLDLRRGRHDELPLSSTH
jgi:hypothetical protein